MTSLRVVVAPDAFKGSLTAARAAAAIAAGWLSVRPADNVKENPQADGGEGTVAALAHSLPNAVIRNAGLVSGPDGRPTPGEWLEMPDGTAVVELAQMSGLPLMLTPDPLHAGTRGLGEVIGRALDAGARSLIIALGGSASTDGGAGALSALGIQCVDSTGVALADGGADLRRLARIDRSHLREVPPGGVRLLTDVSAPLLGRTGAANVFGPQKGASAVQILALDAALAIFAKILGGEPQAPGAGAAGGVAYGFSTAWGATVVPGADYIRKVTSADSHLHDADIVITGEGSLDDQSFGGKVVGQMLEAVAATRARPIVIAGRVSAKIRVPAFSLEELAGSTARAMDEPERWLRAAGARAARTIP